MIKPLRIALAGLGTVGAGVVKLLDANGNLIARRAGRRIEIVAVTARDRAKDRGVDISRFDWIDDPSGLAAHASADVVVELVGGSDGPALTLARETLAAGKALVTANKAMIAHHGLELAEAAEKAGVALKFEAGGRGGHPRRERLTRGRGGERDRAGCTASSTAPAISSCRRWRTKAAISKKVLAEAQALGFAEADPGFDIDGVDAAHKLSILASIAFGTRPDFNNVAIGGIRHVIAADIAEAAALGYRIRLIGIAEAGVKGLFQRVHPHLVPMSHPLAHVSGSLNAVVAEGNFVGRLFFEGAGAGDGPTASAVVADLIDIARGEYGPAFAMPAASLIEQAPADTGDRRARAYVRFTVADKVGVLAEIAAAMRDAGVSIESLIQRGHMADGSAIVAIVTHEGPERSVAQAIEKLRGSPSLIGEAMWMHILA